MKIEKITPQIAALYLGQKCNIEWLITDPDDVFMKGEKWYDSTIIGATITRLEKNELTITPYLHRLESITENEAQECFKIDNKINWKSETSCIMSWWKDKDEWYHTNMSHVIGEPEIWLYLLSKGFDLFNLIDNGLAKDINAPIP